jgi:cyanophycinase-like exopeptidase
VPHFDRFIRPLPAVRRWVRRAERGFGGLGILGIDERTGLLGHNGHWEVCGRGQVTIIDGVGSRTAAAGEPVAAAMT